MKQFVLIAMLGSLLTHGFGQCSITFQANNISCLGMCDGSATALVTGGASPYTYLWQPTAQTTQTISGLCSGTYTCIVTDANSNTCSGSTNVVDPPLLSSFSTTQPASCQTCCDGSATVSPSGGTPPYTYLWSPGNMTTQSISNLCVGNYTICVTDTNACTSCMVVPITAPVADINEINNNNFSVKIFPNPSTGIFTIQSSEKISSIEIYSLLGEKVETLTLKGINTNAVSVMLNAGQGIYFLKLQTENGTATKKLIIQ